MRFPTVDGQRVSANIDEPLAIGMLRHAIDRGVNYVDTAYPYHGGQSEVVVGRALRDGYRDKVRLATKQPVWMVQSSADFDKFLDEQLKRLDTPYIDFYLLHSLNKSTWTDIVLKHDLLARAKGALEDGRIRHLGFSFHDDYACFEQILNGSDLWDFCQIQYNYVDVENQAGTRGLQLVAGKGVAVVVMEPLMGGRLADPPREVLEALAQSEVKRTPAEWALEWLWDQSEVSVVLSGMSTMDQVEDNLRIADRARAHAFTEADQAVVNRARELYRARTIIPCTKCGYCMPCPTGLDIPANFDFFNYAHTFDDLPNARLRYQMFFAESKRAGNCLACGSCEELCPQHIPIMEWMPKVEELLGTGSF
jgi:hypothetical protein